MALLLSVLATVATGCSERPDGDAGNDAEGGGDRVSIPVRVEDDAGRVSSFADSPGRIVSLVPSATGVLLALGQMERIVGRTDFDRAPELQDLPSVGGGLNPSIEQLVSLEPDLVVRFRAESDPDTPRQLDAAGISHVAIRPDRIADIHRIIGMLGTIVGQPERADSIRQSIDRGLREVSEAVAGAPRPSVVFLGGNPPSVAGAGTFLHELIGIAGGENAFADGENLYALVSLEEILDRDVEFILTTEPVGLPEALEGIPTARVPLEMLNPGLEVVESARTLAEIFHPDRFP
ncbi:MAG: helical backbone metal receptor [Gemmatimonadota bacterium]